MDNVSRSPQPRPAVIDHHLARAATDETHRLIGLYELRSLALAFEHTIIRAGIAFTTSAHEPQCRPNATD